MTGVATVAVAIAAGYLLGRLRPWRRLGDWAVEQIRFTGPWVRGGRGRHALVVLAHAVTVPRSPRRLVRAPSPETRAHAPAYDPAWATRHTRHDEGGGA
ncbi:hypothetical protein [Streptomyces zaomyceticus]|uniref:hypothetical protein n=1 Tax=Streptomyces zaomyceticus TaxID=68286 RepID=UPI0036C81187